MHDAETVLFMGFGYNKTNLERLGVIDLPKIATGSMRGLSNQECAEVARLSNGKIALGGGDCMEFVRERIEW
jgi:hypothetical protein